MSYLLTVLATIVVMESSYWLCLRTPFLCMFGYHTFAFSVSYTEGEKDVTCKCQNCPHTWTDAADTYVKTS